MTLATAAAIAYGSLAIIGGIAGYLKAKSKPSLISGIVSGFLLLIAAFMQLQEFTLGLLFARIITIALVCVFILRLLKTRKFMPAGLMLVTGVIALAMMFIS